MTKEAATAIILKAMEDKGFPKKNPDPGEAGGAEFPMWKLAEVIAEVIPYIQENAEVTVDPNTGQGLPGATIK